MTTFQKLNLKDQDEILVLNAPASFEPEIRSLDGVKVRRALPDVKKVSFALAFGTKQKEVDAFAAAMAKKADGDAVVWFAYPKGSSKKYTSELKMGAGWPSMGKAGFEPVRMVAIDEDWSALRFRRVEYIKNLTRAVEHRMTAAGKARGASSRKRS
jgi:hypothetical protein